MKSDAQHWDKIFASTQDTQLGWYEKEAVKTFELLNKIPDLKSACIFISGAGTTGLIDELLEFEEEQFFAIRLVVNDISQKALDRLRIRLGRRTAMVKFICQDIAKPLPSHLPEIDIWIDRAVLHFLIDESDIKGYFLNLNSSLKSGGHVLLAEFSKTGACKCAGLPLHQYSVAEFSCRLGSDFQLVDHCEFVYTNPAGDLRPYVYALYRKHS